MQLTPLITAAGLAVSTTAFLLPLPESSDNDVITTLPVPVETDFTAPRTAEVQKLELACPGCPVPVGHRKSQGADVEVLTDIPSHLELDFSIDHAVDHDRLMLNGFELYPKSDPMHNILAAQVLPDRHEGKHKLPGHRKHHQPIINPLGFGLRSSTIAKSQEDNMELVQVDLQVIEVGNVFVDGIPNVELKLIKTPEGGLLLGGLRATASETAHKTPMDKQKECTTMLCRWRAALLQQLGRVRGSGHCGGRRPAHAAGQLDGVHRHPHSSLHAQAHREHRWSHLLKNIASHILLPIAVGIAAGVLASILGMMIGTAIVYVWRAVVRPTSSRRHHHRRGRSHSKAALKEPAASDEKAGLMANQEEDIEAPPAYLEEGLAQNTKTDENQA
ncbi:uncharacterized protein JN550_001472 [Neoarthrinium moseri]|uniref:uncharacterized protein n=1 Tax=Neoarthrinium moseri TaxID=1658444 RepID=UPI001FDCF3D9|nr:uncharacterized protein JN550_001472 [Neoarthrinium moseri]KAI1875976.1 hypothetical protein JN550_001472 [Neoarthrinium moseri]